MSLPLHLISVAEKSQQNIKLRKKAIRTKCSIYLNIKIVGKTTLSLSTLIRSLFINSTSYQRQVTIVNVLLFPVWGTKLCNN